MTDDDDNNEGGGYREATPNQRGAQRLSALLQLPCLTLGDVALVLDMPLPTLRQLRASGLGPRTFRIGRRVFVTRDAFNAWILKLEKESGD